MLTFSRKESGKEAEKSLDDAYITANKNRSFRHKSSAESEWYPVWQSRRDDARVRRNGNERSRPLIAYVLNNVKSEEAIAEARKRVSAITDSFRSTRGNDSWPPQRSDRFDSKDYPQRLVVGVSGATGIVYAVQLLRRLRQVDVESHLVVSKAGDLTRTYETSLSVNDLRALADVNYRVGDVSAAISSVPGALGMVVALCSLCGRWG